MVAIVKESYTQTLLDILVSLKCVFSETLCIIIIVHLFVKSLQHFLT